MRSRLLVWLGCCCLLPGPGRAEGGSRPLRVDPERSSIEVEVRATFDSFAGQLRTFQADIAIDPDRHSVEKARLSLRMADVRTGRNLRDRHMLEWEESAIYPDVTFQLTSVGLSEGGPVRARGNMLLHGVEHEVTFPVTFLVQGALYSIDGEVRLDYRDYGLPVIRKFWILTVDPQLRVRFHLQGRLEE